MNGPQNYMGFISASDRSDGLPQSLQGLLCPQIQSMQTRGPGGATAKSSPAVLQIRPYFLDCTIYWCDQSWFTMLILSTRSCFLLALPAMADTPDLPSLQWLTHPPSTTRRLSGRGGRACTDQWHRREPPVPHRPRLPGSLPPGKERLVCLRLVSGGAGCFWRLSKEENLPCSVCPVL
jgi:hypothetical protein